MRYNDKDKNATITMMSDKRCTVKVLFFPKIFNFEDLDDSLKYVRLARNKNILQEDFKGLSNSDIEHTME